MAKKASASAIQFARTLGFWDAMALAVVTVMALVAFVAMRKLIPFTQGEAVVVCIVGGLVYLPVVLSLCELSACLPRGTSLYQLPNAAKRPLFLFIINWIFLGGYLIAAAIVAEGLAERSQIIIELFFGARPAEVTLKIIILILISVYSIATSVRLNFGTFVVLACAALLLVLIPVFYFTNEASTAVLPKEHSLRHWLTAIAVVGISLWGVPLALEHQRLYRDGDKTATLGTVAGWLASFTVATLLVVLIVKFPQLYRFHSVTQSSWEDHRLHLFSLLVVLVLLWAALRQIISMTVRVTYAMSSYGFLPRRSDNATGSVPEGAGYSTELIVRTIVISFFIGLLSHFVSENTLIITAAIFGLSLSALLLIPLARAGQSELSPNRWLKLPLHPFFPVTSAVFCGFLAYLLAHQMTLLPASWILFGALCYLVYGREAGRSIRKEETLIAEPDGTHKKETFRVAVLVPDNERFESLCRLARALAEKKGGEVIAVGIAIASEHLPASLVQHRARRELRRIEGLIESYENVLPAVRIASSVDEGILETVKELSVDVIVLPGDEQRKTLVESNDIDADLIFQNTSKPVMAVFGRLPDNPRSILLGAGTTRHAKTALGYTDTFAESLMEKPAISLLRVNTRPTERTHDTQAVEKMIENFGGASTLERREVQGTDLEGLILQEARSADLVVLGASVDPTLQTTSVSGLPKNIAHKRRQATVVVKGSESAQHFFMRRVTHAIAEVLPQVARNEQVEVYSQMRESSRAGIDFYMLMFLASAIATLGLLLNSAGVIIGAMLVAPLMSPILSIASGVVHGNFLMIQRGMRSVLFGILLALSVSVIITIITPTRIPDSEILGRTQPNVLDLLVALAAGAAAAYGVSRKSVAAALPGVAISVALVPPLCVVGFGLGSSAFDIAGGAMLLFLTNFAGIVVVGSMMFYLLGFRPTAAVRKNRFQRTVMISIFVLMIIVVPLGFATREFAQINRLKIQLEELVREHMHERMKVNRLRVKTEKGKFIIEAAVDAYFDIYRNDLERAQRALSKEIGAPVHLRVSIRRAHLFDVRPPGEKESATEVIRTVKDAKTLQPLPEPQEVLELEPGEQQLNDDGVGNVDKKGADKGNDDKGER